MPTTWPTVHFNESFQARLKAFKHKVGLGVEYGWCSGKLGYHMSAQWDVFVSHASEDKERVARPLAGILTRAGLRVWLDENELQLGDSLRRKIDNALASSRYGVVVLSDAFFSKEWPQRELDALSALGSTSQKIILPIWHGVDGKTVARHSPMLADKLAISTDRGLDQVAVAIISVVRGSPRNASQTGESTASRPTTGFEDLRVLAGQSFNGYELFELLGYGGSGVVYRAKQKSTGRDAAVKVFYPLSESRATACGPPGSAVPTPIHLPRPCFKCLL